jgi:hypothetical protein
MTSFLDLCPFDSLSHFTLPLSGVFSLLSSRCYFHRSPKVSNQSPALILRTCLLTSKSLRTTMLLSHFKRLCILLPSLVSALAQDTDPSSSASTTLPVSLQRAVPACAQPCLRASLFDRFPLICTSPVDLNCLCSRYSSSGESLGELALGCIYTSCSVVDSQAATAYSVCLGQEDSVPQTKTALTLVAGSLTRTQPMASPTSVTVIESTPTLRSPSSAQPTTLQANIADAVSTTVSVTSSGSTTSVPAVAASVAPAPSAPTMKPAQIAGLSVAAAATFIVAIGLMALSAFLRKRRQTRDLVEPDEEKRKDFLPEPYSTPFPPGPYLETYSRRPPAAMLPRVAPKQFPLESVLGRQGNAPLSTLIAKYDPTDSATAPRNSVSRSVQADQIGMAVSAELDGEPAMGIASGPSLQRKAGPRQHREKSLRFTFDNSQRPDSVLTQNTVFEEDVVPSRRRSSKLLPAPPVPIPPIRALQPSRPPPVFDPTAGPTRSTLNRAYGPHQPELSLNIPVRHSRSLAETVPYRPAPQETRVIALAPPIHLSTPSPHQLSRAASGTSSQGNAEDIPDYYFTADGSSADTAAAVQSRRRVQGSPRVINIKAKKSASTVSRSTSRASTNIRDSLASQTSFESVDSNDPTPEDEDEAKQLSDDNQLSPVAESPISALRYPKIPRASNQLVPRSPRSPRSPLNQESPKRLPEPSALLVKRRGQKEALRLEGRLAMDSPRRAETRDRIKNYQCHTRSSSTGTGNPASSARSIDGRNRVQSGQWPQSPALYDTDATQPLDYRSRQRQQQPLDFEALKSPAWVPNLTPKRHGDDLFLSVTYSKPPT